jgi:hypothetical protein
MDGGRRVIESSFDNKTWTPVEIKARKEAATESLLFQLGNWRLDIGCWIFRCEGRIPISNVQHSISKDQGKRRGSREER